MKKFFSIQALAFIFTCSLVVTMNSCFNYEEQTNNPQLSSTTTNHRITADQAIANALDFVGQYGSATRGFEAPLRVAGVRAIGLNDYLTRSVNDSINLDSLFYVVNFDNNNGFIIAASDDRETPVFAYVEEGNYEDEDTLNHGYEAFINALLETEIQKLVGSKDYQNGNEVLTDFIIGDESGGSGTTRKPNKFEVMYPLLVTKWDQSTYSTYCPNEYTGCVVTAIAQICSFLKDPDHISWSYNGIGNQCDMDWDSIVNECSLYNGNPVSNNLKDQIANLMRYWGVAFDAEYDTDGTGVDSDDAISTLRDLGYNATDLCDYNSTDVVNNLKEGNRIIYMRGNARYYHVGFVFRKYVDGHGWVVDGYIDAIKNNKESLYVHCNWGWGGYRNGFFLSDVLNAEEAPYYDDNANEITRSSNYRYRLKVSTICK